MKWSTKVIDGSKFRLADVSTKPPKGIEKDEAEDLTKRLGAELDELEDLLFYASDKAVLLVLQGMDTSGKDGTIRFLLKHMNGQSVNVASFKVPTPEELAHDFLWRVHQETPGRGQFTIFNRSHYEDVLVVRVHQLVEEAVWSKRYDHINSFEAILADSNTLVVKVLLHISKDEQEERLLAREHEVEKAWKLSVGDWKERQHWDEYEGAYQDAIANCSRSHAPWYVVPADSKWFRDLAVAEILVETLRPFKESWLQKLGKLGEERKAELDEYRKLNDSEK